MNTNLSPPIDILEIAERQLESAHRIKAAWLCSDSYVGEAHNDWAVAVVVGREIAHAQRFWDETMQVAEALL